jgi:pyruvate dehydrogenase E2 component (dihydrolipoamide acetyltransferase)
MATEFKLPDLGENIESAEIVNVLVSEGDTVEKEQGIIEIETDKATIEVPSSVEGKIVKLHVKSGDNIKVGATIMEVDDNGKSEEESVEKADDKTKNDESNSDTKKEDDKFKSKSDNKSDKSDSNSEKKEEKPESKKTGKRAVVEIKLPDLGENIESADVLNVLVSKGDTLEKDQGILEIETDKATIEVPSNISGKVVEVLIKAGDKAKVGQVILKVESGDGEPEGEPEPKEVEKDEKSEPKEEKEKETKEEKQKGERKSVHPMELDEQPPINRGAAPAAPSVRRIAREIGVDINKVPGSGPNGRISMDDVKAYSKKLHESRAEGGGIGIKAQSLPDFTKFGKIEKADMSNIRKKTAEHLSYAWVTIPHVTQFDKADITNLEKTRKELTKLVEKEGAKLTITGILVKVLIETLKKFPQFNSSIDMEKKEIIYKKYFNIGIAVDTEHGLIVPVIKNADQKSLTEISVEMNELAEKARNKKIGLEDMQGGSMTITNLGGIGGTYFTPIVNTPEVAILGVSRGAYEPVWNGHGVFEPRLMLPLSLSYDHRIIDGADAIRFLRFVVEALENPIKLLL